MLLGTVSLTVPGWATGMGGFKVPKTKDLEASHPSRLFRLHGQAHRAEVASNDYH